MTKHQTYFRPQTWIVPFQCGNCSFRLKFYLVLAFPHRVWSRRSRIGRTFFLATSSQADEGEKQSMPFLAEPREVSLVGPTNKRNDQNETNEAKKTKRLNYSWFINENSIFLKINFHIFYFIFCISRLTLIHKVGTSVPNWCPKRLSA